MAGAGASVCWPFIEQVPHSDSVEAHQKQEEPLDFALVRLREELSGLSASSVATVWANTLCRKSPVVRFVDAPVFLDV